MRNSYLIEQINLLCFLFLVFYLLWCICLSDAVECREQPKGTRTGNLEAPRIDWAECPTPPPLQQSDAEDEHSSGQMPSESHSPEAHLIRNNGLQNDRTSFRKRPQEKPTRSMYRERHNSEDRNGWSHKGGHCRDRTYEMCVN